jgi:hypothetical protein
MQNFIAWIDLDQSGFEVPANFFRLLIRVLNPYSFDTDPDPIFKAEYRFRSGSNPALIRIQGFDDQKFKTNYS